MKNLMKMIFAVGLVIGFYAFQANALTTIQILDVGDSGVTGDGTIFTADANPSYPSTGTGVFEPFFRVGAGNGALTYVDSTTYPAGAELGFNTDAGNKQQMINFDTKDGSGWTRSVSFSELGVIDGYYILSLDANQTSKGTTADNQIVITEMQIFIGPGLSDPEATGGGINNTGYSGTLFDGSTSQDNKLLGLAPVWSLDNSVNGDVSVILQASICDSNGQCGSGHGDLDVLIPQSLLGTNHLPTDNFVLFTEYTGANDGYEEWRFNSASVPEPETMALLVIGLSLIGFRQFRRHLIS